MLTQKQEKFCLAYVQSNDASDAYRKSFNAKKMKPESVWVAASRIMANDKVKLRIKELRDIASKNVGLTLEGHLNDLKILRNAALSGSQYGPAVTAEVHRGKASGLYIEKHEHSGSITFDLSDIDEEALRKIAGNKS